MTQQELEALLARMGSLGPGDFREETKQEEIPNPASTANGGLDPQAPLTIKGPVVYRTWVKPGTNQRLTVKVNADGTYTQTFSGADAEIKPSTDGPKEGDIRGPQTGQKREVFRNGRWVTEDNPVYQPPASQSQPQTVSTNTTEPYIVTRMPNGTITTEKNPNYRGPEQKPSSQTTVKGGDGRTYVVTVDSSGNVTTKDAGVPGEAQPQFSQTVQDKDTGKWWGLKKDGSGWVEIPGGPGSQQARSVGPAMPTFIVGMASDALRAYSDQLNAAVAAGPANGGITAGERDRRWAEALQAAQTSVNEAATIQRQNESNLNARVNLAATKYANEVDGLNNALKFVTDLNGRLEEGSTVGATAFAALIGMQAIARKRSGIDAIVPPSPGDQRSPQGQQIAAGAASATALANAQLARLTNPANPAATRADQQAIRAALEADQQAAAAQAAASAQPAVAVQAAATDAPAAPIMPTRLSSPAVAPAVTAPMPAVQGPASEIGRSTDPHTVMPAINPATGEPTGLTPLPENGQFPQYPDLGPPAQHPETGTTPPYNDDPSQGPVGMAPDQDFAIMRAMQPAQPAVPAADMGGHPLLLKSEAESLPPWRIAPERMQEMEAAGVPLESIWSLPNVGRVA